MTIYDAVSANKRKTIFVMFIFILFVLTISYILSKALGGDGLSFAGAMLIFSGIYTFASYYYSDQIVLALSGAKPAKKTEFKTFFETVENLSIGSGLPTPKIYVINDSAPNAFATGRDPKHAAVAATTGLLQKLDKIELEGVIAHELSHVKNYDTRLMSVVAILVGVVAMLSNIFLRNMWWGNISGRDSNRRDNTIFMLVAVFAAILSPIIATLIQLAVSRRREYLADADGALLTRYPEGLACALEKIASDRHIMKSANLATAHLFIDNPFKSNYNKNWLLNLFSTHPPAEDRIRILRAM
ncbi:MAG: zinc metalloprotease HtpX [Candidatus Levybacteria bacterium RIFCSPHIGHO2_01_FULL_36_15]|nr:MAG: zinc metalloprotease HtpX [Candidatus Levybacteria bacterium RIFCSPHIGHO2_01_FULL_36_15]